LTSILYTIFTTKEDPPADLAQFKLEKKESRFIPDLTESLKEMPATMKKLGLIQFFGCFFYDVESFYACANRACL
jgi:maltose/moltooligosaccharide transporter